MVLLDMSIFLTKYVLNHFKDLISLKTGTNQSFSSERKTHLMRSNLYCVHPITHCLTDFKELSLQAEL